MPESEAENKKVGCLMKINAISGKAIAQATGNYNGEEEVLLAPGSLFKVKSHV